MLAFFWWLIVGVVAGCAAQLLIPARQSIGLWMTLVLGLLGSILGGIVALIVFGANPGSPGFHLGGFILSIVGAVIALGIYGASLSGTYVDTQRRY
jgi:uncharacterized membrane protein YeaQ/YmgE (transglycosylase-associated protein family)